MKKTEMGNTMPRSLTIDEMEHICRQASYRVFFFTAPPQKKDKVPGYIINPIQKVLSVSIS